MEARNVKRAAVVASATGLLAVALCLPPSRLQGAEIAGRALLPVGTTHAGHPVPGFAAVLKNDDGSFSAVTNAGFNGQNPAEIQIRVYRIRVDFEPGPAGSGKISIESFFRLHDPENNIPFAIVESLGPHRNLTAADLDIQSMQRAPDGTFWFGDGFGPFLIHTDQEGKVLEEPIKLADEKGEVWTSQNPGLEEASVVRTMNAFRAHARSHGNQNTLVVSPDSDLLDDCNQSTNVQNRTEPPVESGLTRASSEIFNIAALQRAGFEVIPYTVNEKPRMLELMRLKVNGIISDRPDILRQAVEEFDANGDGKSGDYLDADGLIDPRKFSAQAHRGARNLRPENTIPAMEVALDNLVNTLETDCGITQDGIPVLSHEPFLSFKKWNPTGGTKYTKEDQILIKDRTLRDLQTLFIGDKLLGKARPYQRNDLAFSKVSCAFFEQEGRPGPYQIPSLDQLFRFVEFYADHYRTGAGRFDPAAGRRWKNAAKIRFNLETKLNPRGDTDSEVSLDVPYNKRTVDPQSFAKSVADVIAKNKMTERCDIQSFDFRSLCYVHEHYPQIRTVFLFGDFPKYGGPDEEGSDDGTNLQNEKQGGATPWLAGLFWPYRHTLATHSPRASAGFNGLALSEDLKSILVMLGRPLLDGNGSVSIYEFNLETKSFTGQRYEYLLDDDGSADDLILIDTNRGFVLEGPKAIHEIALNVGDKRAEKASGVNLLNLPDKAGKRPSPKISVGKVTGLFEVDHRHIGLIRQPGNLPSARKAAHPGGTELLLLAISQKLPTR